MYKNIFWLILVVIFTAMISSCEDGLNGADGRDGVDGVDGRDGGDSKKVCNLNVSAEKCRAHNERFCESGGVCPPELLC